jgi:hypothetical protein
MQHEWDFPERPPTRQHRRYYRTVEYQPSGWSSPRVRKVVDIYVHVVLTAVKMLIAIPLSLMLLGSLWLLWVIIGLVV